MNEASLITNLEQNTKKFFQEIKLDWEKFSSKFKKRFLRLENLGYAGIEDAHKMSALAEKIFYDRKTTIFVSTLNNQDLIHLKQAITLADIGKTGGPEANDEQSEIILKIFKANNVKNRETITVAEILKTAYKENWEEKLKILQELYDDKNFGEKKLIDFHNLHTYASVKHLEAIKEKTGLNQKVIDMVARHHILDGVKIGKNSESNGNPTLSFANKILIMIDKYDARRTRGKVSHQEAIKWLKEKIGQTEYAHDEEFSAIIESIDANAESIYTN